ncbi:ankyrin repeat domain-containing protein [Phytophthora cinnamomi]|uniref:ankyrin repeat domain-containing protein n=1 Tax=Phytophthora cinnamomi TaxID=4785 RepID=UPI00355A689F|nr:ankyrin repeat domain-containing protein [Phytophthora cinnamomi]
MAAEDREQEKVAEFVRYAITSDIVRLREMIAKRKMNPNAKDRFGMNAVHWASYVGELECIQELIKAGVTKAKVDINSRSENQDTPLHKAVRGKSIRVLEVLLKLGADANLRNEQNRTPLEELEASMPTPLVNNEGSVSNRVTSARLSAHTEIYNEPVNAEPRPLDFIGLELQPRRESRSVERTDVRSFRSRRSITEHSDRTGRRGSHDESSKWATTPPLPKPAQLYVSPPVSAKDHVPLRKNLRYAGKRVIMAIRVKSALHDTEKLQVMRLMLQKHTTTTNSKH